MFEESKRIQMVDVSEKPITEREATARGLVVMNPATLELIEQGKLEKGDVLTVAHTAGIMAAKRTPELIPLCHPLRITNIALEFRIDKIQTAVEITATVKGTEKTGMEMESLTAVAISALTIYDMCKPVDSKIKITDIRLLRKSGGKSGTVVFEP